MPSSAASVTREIVSGDRSTPAVCRTCHAMSRTDIPFAYSEMITAFSPSDRVACFGTSTGLNDPSRSRGTATFTGPTSVCSVLALDPFRRFLPPSPSSRWASSSAARPACSTCPITPASSPPGHTRCRRDLTGERTREKQRAEKLLESAAIKLSSVVTDLHGVTGRDIMGHLIAGERNPKALAQLARTRARRKITELEHVLDGAEFFTPEHAALLKAMLERIDGLNAEIGKLTAVI